MFSTLGEIESLISRDYLFIEKTLPHLATQQQEYTVQMLQLIRVKVARLPRLSQTTSGYPAARAAPDAKRINLLRDHFSFSDTLLLLTTLLLGGSKFRIIVLVGFQLRGKKHRVTQSKQFIMCYLSRTLELLAMKTKLEKTFNREKKRLDSSVHVLVGLHQYTLKIETTRQSVV